MRKSLFAVAALSALLASGSAFAGGHWKFQVVNKSNAAAMEFRTKEDGKWSDNWISQRIEPGDTFDMDFGTDEGDCSVRTQISFSDGSSFDSPVDYCKVSTLEIYNDHLLLK